MSKWVEIGVVGVDTGQLMLCDPWYIDREWKKRPFKIDEKETGEFSYDGCCKETTNKYFGQLNFKRGHAGAGVVFRTGFGDGNYKVFAKYKDCKELGKRVAEVKVVML